MRRWTILLMVMMLASTVHPASAAGSRVFNETGETVRDALLDFWNTNGGLSVFGLPISDQRSEQTLQGRFDLQHFERQRLELHSENQPPYSVLLGRLGDDLLSRQGRNWHNEPDTGNPLGGSCQHFDTTNRDVCGPFLQYWQTHGLNDGRLDSYGRSLALWGYPLTGVKNETNSSGDTVLTQWFERARFEYHPQNADPFKVLLGRLGAETYDPQHPNGGTTTYVSKTLSNGHTLQVPQGFDIQLLTEGLNRPRLMAVDGQGNVFVAEMGAGRVLVYHAGTQQIDWHAPLVFVQGLTNPHSILVVGDQVYIAAEDQVVRVAMNNFHFDGQPAPYTKLIDLPTGRDPLYGHQTRTLALGPDNKLYISIGSSCDLCVEDDPRRASVMRFNLDGSGGEVFASGLRNSVGIAFRPGTNELWGVDNGRNKLGDNIPPEELNHIVQGGNYGWPYCYGNRVPNPEFNDPAKCANTLPPAYTMDAHIAPLGMIFYDHTAFPPAYQDDALVAIHGSSERSAPEGYNVVRIRFKDGQPVGQEDLVRGWLVDGTWWGRPAGLVIDNSGGLIIADDDPGTHVGRLYRLVYTGSNGTTNSK
ncbi:MAG: PQQ-dependent sugar dehydrogenase [Herpetosiphonaceae bacterium]|nr:PQQ-dependent sugar dehydrogenase [Herpetosiphonaceae bacterium]